MKTQVMSQSQRPSIPDPEVLPFGLFIYERRRQLRLRAYEISRLVGVAQRTIYHWEQGRGPSHISFITVARLAKILRVGEDAVWGTLMASGLDYSEYLGQKRAEAALCRAWDCYQYPHRHGWCKKHLIRIKVHGNPYIKKTSRTEVCIRGHQKEWRLYGRWGRTVCSKCAGITSKRLAQRRQWETNLIPTGEIPLPK
jgi:transcriptional regulator with XRE-family HTH domain